MFIFRSLNKQIKDKYEHKSKLNEDLKRDAERQRELEQLITVSYLFYYLTLYGSFKTIIECKSTSFPKIKINSNLVCIN